MAKMKVIAQKNDAGRLNWIEIYKRRKPLRMDFVWDAKGLTREIEFSGRRQDMPSISDVMLMFNESFIERIGLVKLINLIEKIELIEKIDLVSLITEITNIKNIESLDLIDLITKISEITTVKTVDKITLVDNITTIGTVTNLGTLNLVNTVSEITTIKKIEHIETIGKDNIMLDLLKSGAYIEDRRTIENNGESALWYSHTGDNRGAKFFTRGCMGFIDTIELHCRNGAAPAGTITVYISPNPSLGYVWSGTIDLAGFAVEEWRSVNVRRFWGSDKLFIFWVCSNSDIEVGYDAGSVTTRDAYGSSDVGASWIVDANRYWVRANMAGQSVVILPIGGTVNTIEIPHTSQERLYTENTSVPLTETTLKEINGSGETVYLVIATQAKSNSHKTIIRFYCDGNKTFEWDYDKLNTVGFLNSSLGISLMQYDVDTYCVLYVSNIFRFQKHFKVTVQASITTGQNVMIDGAVNLIT